MQGLLARLSVPVLVAATFGVLGLAGIANAATFTVSDSGLQTAPQLHTKGLIHAGSGLMHTAGMAAGSTATLGRATAQARSGRTLMACLNERTDAGSVFRSAPGSCALHFANKPFDGNDIAPVAAIRWSRWGGSVAQGRGTFHGNMDYTASSTVVVSRPRRCSNGTQNYTWASITTGGIGAASGPLAACPGLSTNTSPASSPAAPGRGASSQMYSPDPNAGTHPSKL